MSVRSRLRAIEQARELKIFDETFANEYMELFYQYTEPQIVDSNAFERTFKQRATPLDEALRTTIAWYRERGNAAKQA